MASSLSLEILDLRHFAAPMLRPVLEAESVIWRERLNWDYLASAKLLLQYLDSRSLPGYVAVDAGRVAGYIFCVYEDSKAVIGDVFALPDGFPGEVGAAGTGREVEESLLHRLLELLVHSPGIDRIESQLLLHRDGSHSDVFRKAGFEVYRRLYLSRNLAGAPVKTDVSLPFGLELRPWHDQDLNAAGRLIAEAYRDHPDSRINDQYRSSGGARRFLHNIVQYPGCGTFYRPASLAAFEGVSGRLCGISLASLVTPRTGHVTQILSLIHI